MKRFSFGELRCTNTPYELELPLTGRKISLARPQLDLEHMAGDVRLGVIDKRSGLPFSQGGHFADSNLVQFPLNGQVTVYDNGVINATTEIRGSDGLFYLKSNSKNNMSTLTPAEWSTTEAQGRVAEAFLGKVPVKFGYQGTSGGVTFQFYPPNKVTPKWTGYPIRPEVKP